ncbi:MAG TPA: M23 family metallopeptidase, partial [Gaiella sp.]|nr:M23 family metallopeptidase [Gaiella sp.]
MHRLLVLAATGLAALALGGSAMAWSWPTDGDVLRPFVLGGDAYAAGQHRGLDVAGSEGSPVRAPAGGTVSFAGSLPTYGRGVTIQTADGYAVTLVHLGSIGVAKGDAVAEGAAIGTVGWSGDAEHEVPSVHLGVRVASQAEGYVDPLGLLPPRPVPAPPPAQAPAPVAAAPPVSAAPSAAVAVPAPASPPPPAAASPPASAVTPAPPPTPAAASPAVAPVAAGPAGVAATASQASAAASASSEVVAPSSGLTVTPGAADATQGEGTTSFRVESRGAAARPANAATGRGAKLHPTRVDTPTSTRATSRPTHAAVSDAQSRGARASSSSHLGAAPRRTLVERPGPTPRSVGVSSVAPARKRRDAAAAPEPTRPLAAQTESTDGRVRHGVVAAAALLLLLVAAAAARAARRIGGNGAVLRHHADLLRQLHAAHRARLHDRGG